MPMVCSMQTVHLSCIDTNTVSKRTKTRFHTTHVSYQFHQVRPKLFMSLWYFQCKPCTYLPSRLALSPNGLNRALADPRHQEVPLGASKMIYESMVRLTQTEHLSCTDTNTISKRTKTRFHTTHVTYEFHRVRPKLFMSLWYVQCKPCTYLASRLALSPNGPN
jgi:gamma-glutamylcysteine synthetase